MSFLTHLLVICVLLGNITSYRFPTEDEEPHIAVLDFSNTLIIFNPNTGDIIQNFTLKGGRGGASNSIEFNYRQNQFYYGDIYVDDVFRLNLNNTNQSVMLDTVRGSPEGLAYDWIHNNLYICLWRHNQILVMKPDTGESRILINITEPRDIEVDPRTGWLYYINGWKDNADLVKCGLDGQNAVSLTDNIERPTSLCLDYSEDKLYWAETFSVNKIYRIDTDGRNRELFYYSGRGNNFSPRFLAVTQDYVYWDTNYVSHLYRRPKYNGTEIRRYKNLERLQKGLARFPNLNMFTGLLVVDPRRQPDSINLCGENTGGCSHFCLPSPVDLHLTPTFTCHCPDNMELSGDNKTCNV